MAVSVQLKKSLVVILKGLGAKMNRLAVNRPSQSNSDSDALSLPRVEEGSNTSTVAQRVVGGDGKGT
jgi:hypothetical protein